MAYDNCPHKWSYQTWKSYEKTLIWKKNYRHKLGGHVRCKDSIIIKNAQDFVRVGKWGIEFTILTYIFFLIYRTISSVNGITLWILVLSVLVPHWILIVPFVWTDVIVHGSLPYLDSALRRIPSFSLVLNLQLCLHSQCIKCFCADCYNQSVIICVLQCCANQPQMKCERACLI